jgi:hypothetical protein
MLSFVWVCPGLIASNEAAIPRGRWWHSQVRLLSVNERDSQVRSYCFLTSLFLAVDWGGFGKIKGFYYNRRLTRISAD